MRARLSWGGVTCCPGAPPERGELRAPIAGVRDPRPSPFSTVFRSRVSAEVGGAVRPGVAGPGHVLGGCVQRRQGSALLVVEQVLEAPAKLAADAADVAGQIGGGDAGVCGHGPDTAAGLGEPTLQGRPRAPGMAPRARSRSPTVACGGTNGVRRDRGACLTGCEPFHLVTMLEVMSPGWSGTG